MQLSPDLAYFFRAHLDTNGHLSYITGGLRVYIHVPGAAMKRFLPFLSLFLLTQFHATLVYSQDAETLLEDRDGDGLINYTGFGDSITTGVGDTGVGGYVLRLESLLGIGTANAGVPGEELVSAGVFRFPNALGKTSDVIGILEGTNDARRQIQTREIRIALQKMINGANAVGKTVILLTPPAPCCDIASIAPYTTAYAASIRDLAATNEIRYADIERAWETSCVNPFECELYNLPEGLHPNGTGYDVMAQTVAATLLGIDVFAPSGAADLEGALGLPAGSVIVKPDLTVAQ